MRAAIFATFPYPARLRAALGPLRAAQRTGLDRVAGRSQLLARLAPEAVAALTVAPRPAAHGGAGAENASADDGGGLPQVRPGGEADGCQPRLPARIPARGERRAVVGMLTGCVQQVLFPQVNAATARVLAAEGCDVIVPPGQGCCGALSLHGGRRAEAAAFARRTIAAFEQAGVDAVIVNAAGCGSAMKEYEHLLAGDPAWAGRAAAFSARVRDFSEFLAELGPVAPRSELRADRRLPRCLPPRPRPADHRTAAQPAGRRSRPRARRDRRRRHLLRLGRHLQPGPAGGGGGARRAQGQQRRATGAELLVSANPGCSLQITQALAATGSRCRSPISPRSSTPRSPAVRLRTCCPAELARGHRVWPAA